MPLGGGAAQRHVCACALELALYTTGHGMKTLRKEQNYCYRLKGHFERLRRNHERVSCQVRTSLDSINTLIRKTSIVLSHTHLGHKHKAPDHEATQPMMGYEPIHKLRQDATAWTMLGVGLIESNKVPKTGVWLG
jgi:hypothetical protein